MDDAGKIMLAVVVIIIIIVILIKRMRNAAQTEKVVDKDQSLSVNKDASLLTERIPYLPSQHLPIYNAHGRFGITADYSPVPYEISQVIVPLENEDTIILDKKMETIKTAINDPLSQLQIGSGAESDHITAGEQKLLDEASVVVGVMLATPAEIEEQEAIKDNARIALMATSDPEIAKYDRRLQREHDFIKKLPVGNECDDFMPDLCKQWAYNNECTINPEFMLKNCAASCFTCKMTDGEKNMLTTIYDDRPSVNCVSHGGYLI